LTFSLLWNHDRGVKRESTSERIKRLSAERGIGPEALSKSAKVSRTTLYNALAGGKVSLESLDKLARFFGVSLDELRGEP